MNQAEIESAVNSSMYHQIKDRGYATTVDVLMDIGILRKTDYEDWRNGRVPFLEKVCQGSLGKLNTVTRQMRSYGKQHRLKESWTFYKQWGRKNKETRKLRFTKSGDERLENMYATHYVAVNKDDK